MKLPRIQAELSLPELSAHARLRGALFLDLADRLPEAMRQTVAARGSSGALRAEVLAALEQARASGHEDADALVVAVAELLFAEAANVRMALLEESQRETVNAERMESAVALVLTKT